MSLERAAGWGRFNGYIGQSWDTVVEAGLGEPTPEESRAIMDLGYWGQEITRKSVSGIKAGKPFSEIEKRAFVLRVFAPDGTHTHRHRSKAKLIEDAKRYGPPTYPTGGNRWGDDDGYRYELEGATISDVFGAPEPAPAAARREDPDGLPSTYDEERLREIQNDAKAQANEDPREQGWL